MDGPTIVYGYQVRHFGMIFLIRRLMIKAWASRWRAVALGPHVIIIIFAWHVIYFSGRCCFGSGWEKQQHQEETKLEQRYHCSHCRHDIIAPLTLIVIVRNGEPASLPQFYFSWFGCWLLETIVVDRRYLPYLPYLAIPTPMFDWVRKSWQIGIPS